MDASQGNFGRKENSYYNEFQCALKDFAYWYSEVIRKNGENL